MHPEPPSTPSGGASDREKSLLRRAEAVFFEVSDARPPEREALMQRLCGEDAALLAEVRSLLGVAEQSSGFLDVPALGISVEQFADQPSRSDALVGQMLGAFRVERRIASGGMGTVYLAARKDGQFDQRVAIKVVKRGMDSEEILRRFKFERQALAALDHPNIARLLDGGITPDGRPFVVMEYVDGRPIDEYCDDKGLSLRDRLALFRCVCDGVHHAHQNLVVHRDLKPSNILVTAQGVPKLLDFGIAKVLSGATTDAVAHTSETERRLTPEYASPEQVDGGPLTTASDVYSLGVVLYELLTGSRPYALAARTSEEIRRVVCLHIPMAPSKVVAHGPDRPAVRAPSGDLASSSAAPPRTATSSIQPATDPRPALDTRRTRRVSSTRLRGLLRGDLDNIVLRALRKEPHRRYASAEQLSGDIERYLAGMPVLARKDTLAYRATKFVRRHVVGVVLTLAVIALLAAATFLLYRQERALDREHRALLAAHRELDETSKRIDADRRFLQTILSGADAGNQGPDARLGTLLEDAAATLRSTPPADPKTLAASQLSLGRAMMSLGLLDRSEPLLQAAALAYQDLPPHDDVRLDAETALAELLFFRGRHADAEAKFRQLLDVESSATGGAPSERRGVLLSDLGASLRLQNKTKDAIDTQQQALQVRIAVHGERSLEVAETRNNLASAWLQSGDAQGAAKEFALVLDIRKERLRPDHPLIVRAMSNLGLALLRLDRVDEAVVMLDGSVRAWGRAFGEEHPGRVVAIKSLAQGLRKQHRPDDAVAMLREALAWQRTHRPDDSAQIAATEANMALALADAGRDDPAMEILRRVLPIVRGQQAMQTLAKDSGEALARLLEKSGRSEEADEVRKSGTKGP